MRIAVGNSRMDKKWKNKEMSWEDFKQKCSQTIRTTETISEYRKMSKPAQDNAKDVGGFVGGRVPNTGFRRIGKRHIAPGDVHAVHRAARAAGRICPIGCRYIVAG